MMNITIEKIDGCPTMTVTKGAITFVYDGMDFLLCKAIIHSGDDSIEITEDEVIMALEEKAFTEEENMEICKKAREYNE